MRSELVWLQSAEYLLVRGEAPAYSTSLEVVGAVGQESGERPGGRAVVYITPQERLYLLVRVEGLRENTAFSVWHRDGGATHLGDFMSTPSGIGSYVYATDVAEWEARTWDQALVGICGS